MATRVGNLTTSAASGEVTPGLTGDLASYAADYWPPHGSDAGGTRATGPRVASLPVRSNPQERAGYRATSYFDDFYNRIHVSPTAIDFGNISPPQTRTFTVWNAFVVPKTLLDVAPVGDDAGLGLAPGAPMVFAALKEVTFTLTATADVAPVVDVEFEFEWSGTSSPPITVTGSAVIAVPWPQLVPMVETLTWSTDVMTALDGSEQAASLRDTPRQTYQLTLHPKDFTGAQHAIMGGYGRGFAVPSRDEGQPCSVVAGATQILCDTSLGDWREMAMIWASETDFEIVEIDSVLADRLVLKRPAAGTRAGRVYPTATARMVGDPRRTTYGFAGMIDVTFEFTRTVDLAAAASPTQWNGYDVLMKSPVLNPLEDTGSQRLEVLDNGTGTPTTDRYWKRAKVARPMRWVVSRAEMWPLRRWLHRRRGQWRLFYHPSFEPDFTAAGSGIVSGALVVLPNGFERYGKTKALAIRKIDGTYVFANITGVTDAGSTIVLAVSPTLGTLNYTDIDRISLMGLKRLASDTVEINHIGGGTHEVSAEFLELE